jgi:hypothetical protein
VLSALWIAAISGDRGRTFNPPKKLYISVISKRRDDVMYIFLLSCLRTSTLDNQPTESNDIHFKTRESFLGCIALHGFIAYTSYDFISEASRMISNAHFSNNLKE